MADDMKNVFKMIEDNNVKYVDFRFTDPRGKWQHTAQSVGTVDEDMLTDGIMFDGSSIAGWKSIEASDMKLTPDTESVYIDPFYAEKTMAIHCSIVEPDTNERYERDPRGTAEKAEAYLKASGIGDASYFGPEAEFFLFDDVRYSVSMNKVSYQVDALDAAWNTDTEYEMGNTGHRPGVKGGYFPVNPIDDGQDIRSEMLSHRFLARQAPRHNVGEAADAGAQQAGPSQDQPFHRVRPRLVRPRIRSMAMNSSSGRRTGVSKTTRPSGSRGSTTTPKGSCPAGVLER